MLSYGARNKEHPLESSSLYNRSYYLQDHFVMRADLEARRREGASVSDYSAAYSAGGALNADGEDGEPAESKGGLKRPRGSGEPAESIDPGKRPRS